MSIELSTHSEFLKEKDKIDSLIEDGYVIKKVSDDLDGSHVEFVKDDKKETLHVLNADSRKYYSSLIFEKQQGSEDISNGSL